VPKFSIRSLDRLSECHLDLQILFKVIIKYWDCSIICGRRNKVDQDSAYDKGFSTVKYPDSKHNQNPSLAVDVIPYPIEWKNTNRMRVFSGFVLGIAKRLKEEGVIDSEIIWGGDWDNDTVLKDQRFDDFPHFQIKK